MGAEDVTGVLDRLERLFDERPSDGRTVQPSLRVLEADADIQLRKACSLLNDCRALRRRRGSYVALVELSFNAVERSFQHYLTDTTSADSSHFNTHDRVYEEMAGKNVFGKAGVVERIDALRQRNRAAMYYDVRKPTREQARAMVDLAQVTHDHLVALGQHQSLCGCDAGS